VVRAAEIVTAHLDFKYRTDTGTQNPQRIGGVVPVCMDGYRMVHGTTRIPGEEIDELRTHVVPKDGDAHILLMIGSTMFRLDVQVLIRTRAPSRRLCQASLLAADPSRRLCQASLLAADLACLVAHEPHQVTPAFPRLAVCESLVRRSRQL